MSWAGAIVVLALAGLGGACSSTLPWIVGVKGMSPEELHRRMQSPEAIQIIDVRRSEEFSAGTIPGSLLVEMDDLEAKLGDLGLDLRKPLVFVCRSGRRTVFTAAMAKGHGFKETYSLNEGLVGWRERGYPMGAAVATRKPLAPDHARLSTISTGQQLATVISGLGFKPVYMFLTLVLIVFLRRSRSRDMILIRWGLVSFLAGESFCALNYMCTQGTSYYLEMLHGLGMVGMGMLVSWGLFVLLDERALGLADPKAGCSLRRLCGRCWKQERVSCIMQRVLLFMVPALALISLMPWVAPLRSSYMQAEVFSTPVIYSYPIDLQLADFRVYPLLAAACFLVAFVLMAAGPASVRRAHLPMFAGVGFMSFSLLRFFLMEGFRAAPAWADFWEEATELLMILGLGLLLFFYRKRLGLAVDRASEPNRGPG